MSSLASPKLVSPDADSDSEAFIDLARRRYSEAKAFDAEDAAAGLLDVDFVAGNQWDEAATKIRKKLKRPRLTWNRMHKFCDQVINEGRQNKPAIKVTAADGGKVQTAELIQSRIRQIEYESDADIAYDTSREGQVISARGFYRITTKWAAPPKWKQYICIEPIENQFSVTYDPAARRYDRSDANYLFVESIMSKSQYLLTYPKSPLAQSGNFSSGNSLYPEWLNIGENSDNVRVAEYWLKQLKLRQLAQLHDGTCAWLDELTSKAQSAVIQTRDEYDWAIWQYIIDGVSVLAKTEWPGKLFPIIPVWGRQEVVRGRKRNVSLGRYGIDAQKLINLYVSNIAENIAMQPKTPWVGPAGSFDDNRQDWEESNNIPKAFLEYKPVTVAGAPLGPPQRNVQEPPIQALSLGLNQAVDALKAAMGIYDQSLGDSSPDTSGLAIQTRNRESDNGNFHFSDNEARSRKYAGRILLELIPKIEANDASISVRSVDGKTSKVKLRQPVKHEDGSTVTHTLDEGSYEPHISTGASYSSQRQEAFKIYSTLAQQDKTFMQIGGDILFRNMDAPGADQLADRYAKMLAPQLQNPGDPAQLNAKLQMSMKQGLILSERVHALQNMLDTKQPELVTRYMITLEQEKTKRENLKLQGVIAEANLRMEGATTELAHTTDAIQHSLDHDRAKDESDFEALLDHYQQMGSDLDDQQAEQDQAGADDGAAQ
jgi:portal protein